MWAKNVSEMATAMSFIRWRKKLTTIIRKAGMQGRNIVKKNVVLHVFLDTLSSLNFGQNSQRVIDALNGMFFKTDTRLLILNKSFREDEPFDNSTLLSFFANLRSHPWEPISKTNFARVPDTIVDQINIPSLFCSSTEYFGLY